MIRLQRKIAHLQNVLDRRYTINNPLPVLIPVVLPVVDVVVPEPEPNIPLVEEQLEEFTDVPEEEIQQREDEQKALEDKLARLELDKLIKKKPRVKKV